MLKEDHLNEKGSLTGCDSFRFPALAWRPFSSCCNAHARCSSICEKVNKHETITKSKKEKGYQTQ